MHNNKVQFFFSLYGNNEKRTQTHTHAQQTNVYENSIYMKINKMAAVWEAQGGTALSLCVWNNNNKFD